MTVAVRVLATGARGIQHNLELEDFSHGVHPSEQVILEGKDEGPMAIIAGIHGNRKFK